MIHGLPMLPCTPASSAVTANYAAAASWASWLLAGRDPESGNAANCSLASSEHARRRLYPTFIPETLAISFLPRSSRLLFRVRQCTACHDSFGRDKPHCSQTPPSAIPRRTPAAASCAEPVPLRNTAPAVTNKSLSPTFPIVGEGALFLHLSGPAQLVLSSTHGIRHIPGVQLKRRKCSGFK